MGVGGNNGVEEGIDGGKGSGVGAYIVLYIYLVSPYCPSDSPLPHFIPLLFQYSLKIGGGLGGANDRKEAFEGDQELYELLFIRKRPLLAMRSVDGGGKGQGLPCPVEVKVRRGRVVYRRGGSECGGGGGKGAQTRAMLELG